MSLVAVAAIFTLVVGLHGCKKEGAAERAGKQLDKTGDDIKDAVRDLKK
jgi:poly(3-hydroxybutyrate) depolymerase